MGIPSKPTVVHKPGELVIEYKEHLSGPNGSWEQDIDQVKITVGFDCYDSPRSSDNINTGVLRPRLPFRINLVVKADFGHITPAGIETGTRDVSFLDLAQMIYTRSAMAQRPLDPSAIRDLESILKTFSAGDIAHTDYSPEELELPKTDDEAHPEASGEHDIGTACAEKPVTAQEIEQCVVPDEKHPASLGTLHVKYSCGLHVTVSPSEHESDKYDIQLSALVRKPRVVEENIPPGHSLYEEGRENVMTRTVYEKERVEVQTLRGMELMYVRDRHQAVDAVVARVEGSGARVDPKNKGDLFKRLTSYVKANPYAVDIAPPGDTAKEIPGPQKSGRRNTGGNHRR